jgi:DNA-binding response OmpR family regulator
MNFLIIDDDVRVAKFIQKGLQAESYNVDIIIDGNHGFQLALYGHYDAIMLDVILPDISGFEICQKLRKHGKKMPILMLSASDALEDKLQSFEAGADDYLTKPFAFEELLARLKAMQRRICETEEDSKIMIADLVLNNKTHQVSRGGEVIQLTPKEFSLLLYLMKRSDRVLCRTMIEEQVWGNHIDSLTNIVDVYIRRLRQKIDKNCSKKLIHTIWGIGYQLRVE